MDTPEDLQTTVFNAIAASSYVPPGELRPEHSLLDLGIDSLVIASIVATVENSIQRKFDPDELLSLFDADSVATFVDKVVELASPKS